MLAHAELHEAIVGLTGNRELVLAERHLMIGSLLFIDLINWELRDSEKMYVEHLRLVNALLEPNVDEARRLTEGHLSMVFDAVKKRLPEAISDGAASGG